MVDSLIFVEIVSENRVAAYMLETVSRNTKQRNITETSYYTQGNTIAGNCFWEEQCFLVCGCLNLRPTDIDK